MSRRIGARLCSAYLAESDTEVHSSCQYVNCNITCLPKMQAFIYMDLKMSTVSFPREKISKLLYKVRTCTLQGCWGGGPFLLSLGDCLPLYFCIPLMQPVYVNLFFFSSLWRSYLFFLFYPNWFNTIIFL